jgi:hypothetical protein
MWPTSALFEGDLSLLRPLIPAWLPQPIANGRVDIWTVEAVLTIAKRLDEMEARTNGSAGATHVGVQP